MTVVLGTGQQILDLLDKGLPALRIGPAKQLLGLLPGQSQAMQSGADRLAAAGPAEPLAHPADQTPQGPARWRIGASYRRRCGGALGGTDRLAEAGLEFPAQGGGAPGGGWVVVRSQPLRPRLRVPACLRGTARGAALLSDLIEPKKALAAAR